MTNVTVVFEYEEPEYCRLCLSEPTKHNELTTIGKASASEIHRDIIPIIRELLKIELNPETDSGSFICSTCLESLVEFHQYKSRCRTNDSRLQEKATERKQKQIELAKSAIQNTDVLDQVKEGDPIKVIIRMNAEGKTSVSIQVQSKQPVVEPPKPSDPPPPVAPTRPVVQAKSTKTTIVKPVKLPSQEFYFYKTLNSNCGLIYGGYRYCASIPRWNGTHWICEQRRSHNCKALIYVDKTYHAFYLHAKHIHEPPLLRPNLSIYKASDVLSKVIEKERQIRVIRQASKENSKNDSDPVGLKALDEALACKDMQIKEESDSDLDSEEEDEDMDSNDGFLPVLTDSKLVDGEMLPVVKVKEEDDEDGEPLKEVAPHVVPPAKGIKINAGDNTYFIKELT